jgi:hypothetical protein
MSMYPASAASGGQRHDHPSAVHTHASHGGVSPQSSGSPVLEDPPDDSPEDPLEDSLDDSLDVPEEPVVPVLVDDESSPVVGTTTPVLVDVPPVLAPVSSPGAASPHPASAAIKAPPIRVIDNY